nr:SWIM zinc finger family protein [Actinomycetota bacterium]
LETCDCPDHARRGSNCKHLLAVGILKASRRSGVREVRTLRVVAGDPFAYAGKRGGCPSCFAGYVTLTVEEDGQERDEPVPCRRCSR